MLGKTRLPALLSALLPALLALAALAALALLYLGGQPFQDHLVNSDALYLPTLFDDLFVRGVQLADWFLTPAPYFFPDFLLYGLAWLAADGAYHQVLVFGLLQLGLATMAVYAIAHATLAAHRGMVAALACVLLAWLAANADLPFALLLASAHHAGAFLALLAALALWLHDDGAATPWTRWLRPLLCLLCLATVLSDTLFLLQAVVPMAAAIVLCRGKGTGMLAAARPLALPLLVSGLLGMMAYKHVVAHPTRHPARFGLERAGLNLRELADICATVFAQAPLLGLAVAGFAVFGAACLLRSLAGRPLALPRRLQLLVSFSILSMAATLLALVLNKTLPPTARYMLPVFCLPLASGSALLAHYLHKCFYPAGAALAALCTALLAAAAWPAWQGERDATRFYPPDLACIDQALAGTPLRHGIAQYWDAKRIQALSRHRLTLAQYTGELARMEWITSERFYQPAYDFAVIAEDAPPEFKLPLARLLALNGKPAASVRCGQRTLLLYGQGRLRVSGPSGGATAPN